MFFNNNTSLEQIKKWLDIQLTAVKPVAKNGIDIEIKPHKTQRTKDQNRFLMVVLSALVKFYHETGFIPTGLSAWAMRTDILKEFYKARFGVISTQKLDTKSFSEFIDNIQRTLVEETQGEWEIIETDSAYLKSLMGEL